MTYLNFKGGKWSKEINVRDFILKNITPYEGDDKFLSGPTDRTNIIWEKISQLLTDERNNGGVLDVDTKNVSTITAHDAGYIDKSNEVVVGLQTDAPLKRAIMPFGGIRMFLRDARLMVSTSTLPLRKYSLFTERLIMLAYMTPIPKR